MQLKDGDLLLVDAGAEYKGYASDITRTFPINGKFTQAQRDIYDLVLEDTDVLRRHGPSRRATGRSENSFDRDC